MKVTAWLGSHSPVNQEAGREPGIVHPNELKSDGELVKCIYCGVESFTCSCHAVPDEQSAIIASKKCFKADWYIPVTLSCTRMGRIFGTFAVIERHDTDE